MTYEKPILQVAGAASTLLQGPPQPGADGGVISGIGPNLTPLEEE